MTNISYPVLNLNNSVGTYSYYRLHTLKLTIQVSTILYTFIDYNIRKIDNSHMHKIINWDPFFGEMFDLTIKYKCCDLNTKQIVISVIYSITRIGFFNKLGNILNYK